MILFVNESMEVKAKEFMFEDLYSFTNHVLYLEDTWVNIQASS